MQNDEIKPENENQEQTIGLGPEELGSMLEALTELKMQQAYQELMQLRVMALESAKEIVLATINNVEHMTKLPNVVTLATEIEKFLNRSVGDEDEQ